MATIPTHLAMQLAGARTPEAKQEARSAIRIWRKTVRDQSVRERALRQLGRPRAS